MQSGQAPSGITSLEELEERLSRPPEATVQTLKRLEGDLLLLGAGGKIGPSLARMARRASDLAETRRRIIGVSRFSAPGERAKLEQHGIETIACDLLDPAAVAKLPDAPNVVFLAGMKFGATGQEARTWAMNAYLPALVCERFRQSRMVAYSTGSVYALTSVRGRGSLETDTLEPVGEYAMSCVGRERMFEYFSRRCGTPVALIRLNYACELRYGVLVDVAQRVLAGKPVDLRTGYFNIIWQGDANGMVLRAFDHAASPPAILNLTGPEQLSVREVAQEFGRRFGCPVIFEGAESATALLSNARRAQELFGQPEVTAEQLEGWVAAWLQRHGPTLGKPTHFEVRDGRY